MVADLLQEVGTKMTRKFCEIFFVFVFLLLLVAPEDSMAIPQRGPGRQRSCDANGKIGDGLKFDAANCGIDCEFVIPGNEVCTTVAALVYLDAKWNIALMNKVCQNNGFVTSLAPSPMLDAIDIGKATTHCATQGNYACCNQVGRTSIVYAKALAALASYYLGANSVYENTSVCGSKWMKPNPSSYDFSAGDYKQTVQLKIDGFVRDNPDKLTGNCNSDDCKTYREWFYGGIEYEDNPYEGKACVDPTREKDKHGNYPKQRYYLKGIEAGNYNCKQYLVLPGQNTPYNKDDMREAYKCCLDRSQNFMCIDYTNVNVVDNPPVQMRRTPTFCKKGERCTMMRPDYYDSAGTHHQRIQNGGIWFSVKSSDSEGRLLCAESYSLCPFNFYVGGGADECVYYRDGKYDDESKTWKIITQEQIDNKECEQNSEIRDADCEYNDKIGKCKNYCQYLTHCTKTASDGYEYQSSIGSPYFAQACLDFVGDSKNNAGYNTGEVIMGKQVHFTAPIAQCMKETLENLFYNRAGHSKCLDYNETPDSKGVCATGKYITDGSFVYKKGNKVKDNSFFETIQKSMSLIIKLAITFAITFYGVNLLLGKANLGDKKSSLVFILKIALVMYFCVGTAWQDVFFRGFYDASMSLAEILFKIEIQNNPLKQDGCQFGKIVYSDGSSKNVSTYPEGKSYLAIWDTIDCKMMRYLGVGPQINTANFASMALAAYFFGPIGIYFAMSVLIFAFLMIMMAIRALHIFLSSAMAIILLVFISPLIIPCGMFEKTKNIFTGWLGKLFSYCLQPMILFAYVAIFISVMDQTLVGSAIFKGNPPNKTMSCAKACYDDDGNLVPYDGDQAPACDQDNQNLIDPLNDSMACLLDFKNFGTFKVFQAIGISLPILKNLLSENVKQRVLTLLKATIVMYLLYKFMDEIPGITESLVGGGLGGKQGDAVAMLKQAMSIVSGAATRAARATRKHGGNALRDAAEEIELGNGPLKAESAEAKRQDDSEDDAGKAGGGGDDGAGKAGGDDPDSAGGGEGDSKSSSDGAK